MFRMLDEIFSHSMTEQERQEAKQEFGRRLNDDAEFIQHAARLEEKRKEAIAKLGEKWVLHPIHQVHKNNRPANLLGSKVA